MYNYMSTYNDNYSVTHSCITNKGTSVLFISQQSTLRYMLHYMLPTAPVQ